MLERRLVMKGISDQINEEKLKATVKRLFSKSVPRYFHHTISVVENMKKLIKGINDPEDETLLIASAYLHDIGYSETYGDDYVGNIKDQGIKIKLHSERGAKIAERLLNDLGMRKAVIQKVAWMVSVHHREDVEDRHLKLLLEADKLPS